MSTLELKNRYMEFRIGGQVFGVPLLSVKEVVPKPEIVPVPNMPQHFEGMINLRGQILGVINVRKKLSVQPRSGDEKRNEVIIVIEQNGFCVGMIVDEVTRVIHTEENKVGPAPLSATDPAKAYVSSVIQTEEGLVLTIQVETLLELDRLQKTDKSA